MPLLTELGALRQETTTKFQVKSMLIMQEVVTIHNASNPLLLYTQETHNKPTEINSCPAEPRYTLPLQTVQIQISWLPEANRSGSTLFVIQYVNFL